MHEVFWCMWTRSLLRGCTGAKKTGLHSCKRLLGDHSSSRPKHLLHPLLTTFGGNFGVSGLCIQRHFRSQSYKTLAHRNRSDFAICDCDAHRGPQKSLRFPRQEKAMLHCDLRLRWKVASDWRFRAAISEPKTPSLCGMSGDLAPSTRKSLAIAIVRFWCAKYKTLPPLPIPIICFGLGGLTGYIGK